jgi:hypothetical protein
MRLKIDILEVHNACYWFMKEVLHVVLLGKEIQYNYCRLG